MAGRNLCLCKGHHDGFNLPYNASNIYRVGRQPYAPGESQMDSGGPAFNLTPWPNTVPALNTLASNPGIPRNNALGITNNSTSSSPNNYLFMSGFAGKSKG